MNKNLMYYVHKNRKDTWRKIAQISAKTGEGLIKTAKKYKLNADFSNGQERNGKVKYLPTYSAQPKEEPSNYMLQALAEVKKSPSSPVFKDVDGSLKYLRQEAKKYAP